MNLVGSWEGRRDLCRIGVGRQSGFAHSGEASDIRREKDFSEAWLESMGERFFVFIKWIRLVCYGTQCSFTKEGKYPVVEESVAQTSMVPQLRNWLFFLFPGIVFSTLMGL